MRGREPHIFFSAGDVSGDAHVAHLIEEVRRRSPNALFRGLGGDAAERAGAILTTRLTDHAILGFSRAVRALPLFMGILGRAARELEETRPDVCVLVDFPGFNVNLAALARARGIPVVYYICPQLWAWAPWRVRRFRRLVDHALVIFPFEETFYLSHGVDAKFIGHPVADTLETAWRSLPAAERDDHLVCLLPGSRRQEIRANFPLMLETAKRLRSTSPDLRFHCPHLDPARRELLREFVDRCDLDPAPTIGENYYQSLRRARLALVASGTATLEVALSGTPMVVIYKIDRVLRAVGHLLLTVPHIAQVNLIAGREVVPEILTAEDDVEDMVREAQALLEEGDRRVKCLSDLAQIREAVGSPGAAGRAAEALLKVIEQKDC